MSTKHTKKLSQNETGFASLVIALVLIIILSLLTVGFAQLARREQQTALNKQLAVQANYAAESGINDIVSTLPDSNFANKVGNHPDSCLTAGDYTTLGLTQTISSTGASYTCAIVNLTPNNIPKQLNTGQSWVNTFSTDKSLSSLTIGWDGGSTPPSPNANGTGAFPPASTWNSSRYPAVLQFSITPLTGALDRTTLTNSTLTVFLYPTAGSGNFTYASASSATEGTVIPANCGGSGCAATITFPTPSTGPYLIHLLDYYTSTHVSVTGTASPAAGGGPVEFLNSVAEIDVTGKARNVLKRLQESVPIAGSPQLPAYALEAQNICKELNTQPNGTTYTAPTTDPNTAAACSFNNLIGQ